MEYKTLTELRNLYPEERDIQSSYSKETNSINYKGRYDKNSINFTIEDLSEISVVSGTSFNFILEIDGNEYISPQFKSFLENSISSGNPYIQKSSVARFSFTKDELTSVSSLTTREQYAEVRITKNLNTDEDIVRHVDWLVDSKTQTLRNISNYGEYSKYTTTYNVETDSGIGLEYSEAVQSGAPYVANNESVTPQEEPKKETKKTLTTSQIKTTPSGGSDEVRSQISTNIDISTPSTTYKPTSDFFRGFLRKRRNKK